MAGTFQLSKQIEIINPIPWLKGMVVDTLTEITSDLTKFEGRLVYVKGETQKYWFVNANGSLNKLSDLTLKTVINITALKNIPILLREQYCIVIVNCFDINDENSIINKTVILQYKPATIVDASWFEMSNWIILTETKLEDDTTPKLSGPLNTNNYAIQESWGNLTAIGELTIPLTANAFIVNTDSNLNLFSNIIVPATNSWFAGNVIKLLFVAGITIKHGFTGIDLNAKYLNLACGTDYVTKANQIIEFVYDGGTWHEINNLTKPSNVEADIAPKLGGTLDTNYNSIQESNGFDIETNTNLFVTNSGNNFRIFGPLDASPAIPIETISKTNWRQGSKISLYFDVVVDLINNIPILNDNVGLKLISGTNYTTKIGDILDLWFNGNFWYETNGLTGGNTIISKTYVELQILVNTNNLSIGQKYLLTNYRTKHVIPNSFPIELNVGELEPIILTTISANQFHIEVKSTIYPTDIIHYRFDDNICENGTRDVENKKWINGTSRTGYILFRKSITNNLSTHYDWRNYKIRRWKIDAITWVSNTNYIVGDLVKSPTDNNIWISNEIHSGTIDPVLDEINWHLWLQLNIQDTGGFLSFTPDKNILTNNKTNTVDTNLIINNTTPDIDYKDYFTFCILSELTNSSGIVKTDINGIWGQGYNNFEIGKFDFDYFNHEWGNGNDLESNVFYLIPNGSTEYYVKNVKIGTNFLFNTINTGEFYENIIGNNFFKNIIGIGFIYNNIGNNFYENIIGQSFNNNIIGVEFINNLIGNTVYQNNINNSFQRNKIKNDFQYNKIFKLFMNNYLFINFKNNTIFENFNNNKVNANFQFNEIKNEPNSIDWLNAAPTPTHIYYTYNKTIFKNSAGNLRLSYYDENDQLIITDIFN